MNDYDEDQVVVIERGGGVGAFLWGALIGAAAMLLYAPRSGAETRRELTQSLDRLRETTDATLREVQDTVTGTVRDVRENVETQVDATRSALDAGRQAARAARTDIGQRWEQGRDGVRSAYRPRPAAQSRESDEE